MNSPQLLMKLHLSLLQAQLKNILRQQRLQEIKIIASGQTKEDINLFYILYHSQNSCPFIKNIRALGITETI